ncbi:dihydropteroate synthase [Halalkaliarchaeum desulfuricum]|uniref:Probable bifunctional folylpolyglutamate synthase/dihydropteroate synthase n=1 Tax=Halalkaliarchaeum desulfuricum TaxID=2055893 RepID=A0A343TMK0_9EURY|nr:dihydropteroate synthase [Halalkaliarchaeum desulfuricum]AUX10322.1 dihydropteroate synthase [Halalkaliarchaeum desulfuricum]
MDYHEAANFLFGLRRFAIDPGTDSVMELLAELGDPQKSFDSVQIAGSNGKGSTARMVESILRAEGKTVGLYTSPHLGDLGEEVRIDGRPMADAAIAEFVSEVRPFLLDRSPADDPLTFFEVVTAMALWQFDRADVDVAVLEVGMGGEYDATSAVDPIASCVTNVSLEHTEVLGDTVEEIARTKAAVAPTDAPLVTAATGDALAAIREVVGEVFTVGPDADRDLVVTPDGRVSSQESAVRLAGDGWEFDARIPLLGDYQATNAGVAVALAGQVIGFESVGETPDDARSRRDSPFHRGLRRANWPGRFEVLSESPLVVLDGAHNPDACSTVAETLSTFAYDDLEIVLAAMHDKDHAGMAAALPDAGRVTVCEADLERAADADVLSRAIEATVDPETAVETANSVPQAFATARERAGDDDAVLLTGSLSAVREARAAYTRLQVPTRVENPGDAERVLENADVPPSEARQLADGMSHHVVRTRLEPGEARTVRTELLRAGGECGVSGVESGERVSVVLSGTRSEFDQLIDALESDRVGLPTIAAELRQRLELDTGTVDEPETGRNGGETEDGIDAGPAYPWEEGTAVMGILNVTPDSFHDGGEYYDLEDAVTQAETMVEAGADIVDVGGESTRPGAEPISIEEEIRRVVPVIEAVSEVDALVSVDSRRAAVAEAALDAGADILNDVTGLEDPEMRFLAAERDVPVVVMHSVDAPVVPGQYVEYDDVVDDVMRDLRERVLLAEKAGVPRENVVIDPGLGFGKSAAESFELLDRIEEFTALGCPVLVGHSHKSMFERAGGEAGDAYAETVAGTAIAVDRGADIVRVHDVPDNVAAVNVAAATREGTKQHRPR